VSGNHNFQHINFARDMLLKRKLKAGNVRKDHGICWWK